jgi:hypothetical protein
MLVRSLAWFARPASCSFPDFGDTFSTFNGGTSIRLSTIAGTMNVTPGMRADNFFSTLEGHVSTQFCLGAAAASLGSPPPTLTSVISRRAVEEVNLSGVE